MADYTAKERFSELEDIQNEAWVGNRGQKDGNERLRSIEDTARRSNIPLFGSSPPKKIA